MLSFEFFFFCPSLRVRSVRFGGRLISDFRLIGSFNDPGEILRTSSSTLCIRSIICLPSAWWNITTRSSSSFITSVGSVSFNLHLKRENVPAALLSILWILMKMPLMGRNNRRVVADKNKGIICPMDVVNEVMLSSLSLKSHATYVIPLSISLDIYVCRI